MDHEKLNKVFDISDQNAQFLPRQGRVVLSADEGELPDVEQAKANLKSMIRASSVALEELINLSIESQSSKHYDSLANLLKALNESNRHLVDFNKEQAKEEATVNNNTQINNTVFVGSTSELQKLIQEGLA
jgi:hypothetical protein